jgi:hypothetical protein
MGQQQTHAASVGEVKATIKSIEHNPSGGSATGTGATANVVSGGLYNKKKGGKK